MLMRLVRLWSVLRTDLLQLWHAWRHPRTPRWFKLGCVAVLAYLLLPVDLLPDVIPVLGWADDLVLIPLVLRWLLSRLPAQVRGAPTDAARPPLPVAERVR